GQRLGEHPVDVDFGFTPGVGRRERLSTKALLFLLLSQEFNDLLHCRFISEICSRARTRITIEDVAVSWSHRQAATIAETSATSALGANNRNALSWRDALL